MALPDQPPARHREVAEAFTRTVVGTRDWDAPSPVDGWLARDVVRHLTEWLPALVSDGAGVQLASGPSVDVDPVQAWQVHQAAVQELLDDPSTSGRLLRNRYLGEIPLDQAVDRYYTTDVFLHTWDLARATGQDEHLDAEVCADLLAGMEPYEELMRTSGQYGPRVPVPDDADPQARLLGFIGRNPFRSGSR